MSQYENQRDQQQMNQYPFYKHSTQVSYQNKDHNKYQQSYQNQYENFLREEIDIIDAYDNNQNQDRNTIQIVSNLSGQHIDQDYNEDYNEDNYVNILDQCIDNITDKQDYFENEKMESPGNFSENYQNQKNNRQINNQVKQNFNNEEYQNGLGYQCYLNTDDKIAEQLGVVRAQGQVLFVDQDDTNSQQNQMSQHNNKLSNATKKANLNNPLSINSWCENNIINNDLNGCNQKNYNQQKNNYNERISSSQKQQYGIALGENYQQYLQNMRHEDILHNEQNQKNGNIYQNENLVSNCKFEGVESSQICNRNTGSQNYIESTSFVPKLNIQIVKQHNIPASNKYQQGQSNQYLHQNAYSNKFILDDQAQCQICQNSHKIYFTSAQIVSRLYTKYASSQNYYYTRDLNEILNNFRTKAAIQFKDMTMFDEDAEYLKRYYNLSEYPKKSKLLTEYYKFHKDIPRLFMLPETYILNNFHDKKRRFDYYRIAQLIEEENKKNPDRPPKGIVGEKPALRTNESSEEKQEQVQPQKQVEQSEELLLGDISSFINRGQIEDDQMILEQDLIANSNIEDLELTDRFVQCLNFQKQNGGPINSVSSLNSLKINQGQKNNNSREDKLNKNNQANSQTNQKGKVISLQQNVQLQSQVGSSSQLQQYEISASAFLNYQKKLEQYKNSKKKENGQINNAKQSIPSASNIIKQQVLSSQQQMIQEKSKKKTTRTDASLTIHELNQKLEEIVTSHSLVSSHIVEDDSRQQFDYRELDQFLKFLNQKEKENQFTINPNKIQFNYQPSNQQQNPQTQSLNDFQKQLGNKDTQSLLNTKDINLTNKNIQINNKNDKKNNTNNMQNFQTQQMLLQQAIQHNKQNSIQQNLQQNTQFLNDTSRNNLASANNPSNQQQIIQNQLAQLQQNQSNHYKKINVKPSKSEIINIEQLKNNNMLNNDMQILAINEMDLDNYAAQQQLNQQIQNQQVASYLKNNNYINQNQSKKRLTPQLRLDDIEYFNDNKLTNGKSSLQQQHTGSVSVKFSHRDSLNSQQTQNCIRSARDQYPTTTTNKYNLNVKGSCDSKLTGLQVQQSSQTTKSNSQTQFQIFPSNQIQKDQLISQSQSKQSQFGQYNINQQSQFQQGSSTKNNFPNSMSSISVANKLDTKESQLFTPRQPQIQPGIIASSMQKNLNKANQALINKPPLSPRDSLPSPKNSNSAQNENFILGSNTNNQNQQNQESLSQNQMNANFNSVSLDQQNLIAKSTKNNTTVKKKQNQYSQSIQQQYVHNNSNSNQGNNNSITVSNQVSQNLPSGSILNQQQSISSSQLMNKKGSNMKQLNLKLKLDQLNFSKEKTCHNDNISNNQIIKEPLSQRSCSSKNIDLQTPKYNLYEMFKQQISNQAYATAILKSDQVPQKQQNNKNINSHSTQISVSNQAIPQQQKNVAFQIELQNQNQQNKVEINKNQTSSAYTASNEQSKQQKQQQQNLTNQYQPFILSPSQQKTTLESFTQQSPTQSQNNIVKVLLNFNSLQANPQVQVQQSGQVIHAQQQNSNNNSSNLNGNFNTNNNNLNQGIPRTTTNSTNRKTGATFIHINSSGNNIQINSPKQQLEQQKKVISQQTTRSEANTRKNSQVKTAIEKSHHSTATNSNAAIPATNSMNINSKHVSRNSSLEINNNPNVLRKKSPQLFKYQQKETKNVYNLVQQLSNNFTQSTPKQTVSARNYQTQRNSINNFDFQKPDIASQASQNQLSIIQQSTLVQSPSYNNSVNTNINQQMIQGKQQTGQIFDSESNQEQIAQQFQQNTPVINNYIQNSLKNNIQAGNNNQHQFNLTPNASNLSQSAVQQIHQFQKGFSQTQQLFNTNNGVQQSKMVQSTITNSNSQAQQAQKVSSPQIKKVANMHKHTKSENLMNLIIETNIQNLNQQNQIAQTPQHQILSPNSQSAMQSNTIKKNQKNQIQALSLMNNPSIPSNATITGTSSLQAPSSTAISYQQQQHNQFQQQYQSVSSQQLSPRLVLNQNFQLQNEKQQNGQIQQQIINQQVSNNNQFLNKKQSLASPLSSRSTQMNFQVELFRSTNNSTNNNNSNTNNTNSQHNNYPNSGVNNNSSSMNSQLNNNNNFNNNSNNSTTQQVNSSLNANNNFPTGSTSTNTNTFNQLNYASLSSQNNSNNVQQLANTILQQNSIQKKGGFVQSQINGFFSMQSNNTKQNPTSSTVTTCNSNTNIISNNLLKTTQDNSLQAANINKKTKKKSMF